MPIQLRMEREGEGGWTEGGESMGGSGKDRGGQGTLRVWLLRMVCI
jgi:hypothetical protein